MTGQVRQFDQLNLGERATLTRCYAEVDISEWGRLAATHEPAFGVPEPLIAAMFSNLLGEELPGHGTNYLKQSMVFHGQAQPDETLTAEATVVRLRPEKALVNLETVCRSDDGRLICEGEALVLFNPQAAVNSPPSSSR